MATETPDEQELPSRKEGWRTVFAIAVGFLTAFAWVVFCRTYSIPMPACVMMAVIIHVMSVHFTASLCSFAIPALQRLWGGATPRARRGKFVAANPSDWRELDDETWLRVDPGRIGVVTETSSEGMAGIWFSTVVALFLGSVFTWAGFIGTGHFLPICFQSLTNLFALVLMTLFLLAGLTVLYLLTGLTVSKVVTRVWLEGEEVWFAQKVYRFGIPIPRRRRAPRDQVRARISFDSDPKWDDSWTYRVDLDFAGKELKLIPSTSAPRGDGWSVIKAAAEDVAARLDATGVFAEIITVKE